jgi:type I restriction enzyme S subunit
LFQYFNSNPGQQQILESAIQTGVPHTNLGILKAYKLFVPLLSEQRAIADALGDADALIASLDCIVAKKRDLRQAGMQQLLTGKIRLPGFNSQWETKPLGDVLKIRHGKSQKGVEVNGGRFPILATGGEIGRTNSYLYDKPSVLIGRKGTIDAPQFVETPFWTIDTLFFSEISADAIPKFIFYKFLAIDWRNYNEASGVPSLSSTTIEKIEIAYPEKEEQSAIAAVLSDMDDDLAAVEGHRDKAHALKQGMLQQLLTGRIRLK